MCVSLTTTANSQWKQTFWPQVLGLRENELENDGAAAVAAAVARLPQLRLLDLAQNQVGHPSNGIPPTVPNDALLGRRRLVCCMCLHTARQPFFLLWRTLCLDACTSLSLD